MTRPTRIADVRRAWLRVAGGLFMALALPLAAAEIHEAVLAHDLDRVRQLLLERPELANARNEKGDTPLYIAAFRGYAKQMVPLLLQFGADPAPPPNERRETPLSISRELNMKQTATLLLRAGAREDDRSRAAEFRYLTLKGEVAELNQRAAQFPVIVNARNAYGQTPLALAVAAEKPNEGVLRTLLTLGADPNATNNYGGTPYSIARELERTPIADLLRQRGGQESLTTRSVLLRLAVRKQQLPEVAAIIERNPEFVSAHDEFRRTALHLASAGANLVLVELLLRHKAEVNALDFADNTPLHNAALARNPDLLQVLVASKADINRPNRQRYTPLHNAAGAGSLAAVEVLLAAGADLKAIDNVGETALHRAASAGHVDIMKLLLDRGMDLNIRDRQRQTPLHQAAQAGRVEAVKFLLARGADRTAVDVAGLTPLALAEKRKLAEVAKLLGPVPKP